MLEIKPTMQALIASMEEHAVQVAQEIIDEERKERNDPMGKTITIVGLVDKLNEIIALLGKREQDHAKPTAKPAAAQPYKPAAYDIKINRDGAGAMSTVTMTPKP